MGDRRNSKTIGGVVRPTHKLTIIKRYCARVLATLIVHSAQGIDITSARKSRVEVHRAVNAAMADAFADGLHALAIEAKAR